MSETYDYATSGIHYEDGKQQHVHGTHYVLATGEEFSKWTNK